jgi:hypothetical protein
MFALTGLTLMLCTLLTCISALPTAEPATTPISPFADLATRAIVPTCTANTIGVDEGHWGGLYYIIKNQERNWTLATNDCVTFTHKTAKSRACGVSSPGKISSQEWCERYKDIGYACLADGKGKGGQSGSSAGVKVTLEHS